MMGGDQDQPVDIQYVCDSRFVVTSTLMNPVKVVWRVVGGGEDHPLTLRPTPAMHIAFSDAPIAVEGSGAVEVLLAGKRIAYRENGRVPCPPAAARARAVAVALTSAETGEWSAPFDWPIVAVHLHLLPNGQVLSWGHYGTPQIWDPASGAFTPQPSQDLLFCAGHAFLPDGRLFVAGGHIAQNHGLPVTNLYGASTGWTPSAAMSKGRWYPSVTVMPNGQAVILAGTDQRGAKVAVPEVWSAGSIRALTGANRKLPYYPRAFVAPNGLLFNAGKAQPSAYLDLKGAGKWVNVAPRRFSDRDYGGAVMYSPGKILFAGGGLTTATAETIDLNQPSPAWSYTGSMAFARRHHTLTMLPTGEVLATVGVAGTAFNDLTRPVFAAEIWNPDTGVWRTVASSGVPRGYHATAVLMPDGRVLQSGAGDADKAVDQKNAELYSPPYLFAGPRPTITSAPATPRVGRTMRVVTPDAASITRVSLIGLGSDTHAFNSGQRYESLSFAADATGLTVSIPASKSITPPGYYMLFIVNAENVPSEAKIVRVR